MKHKQPPKVTISTLLADHVRMSKMEEHVKNGASVGTVEAIIMMPKGLLMKWLKRGEAEPRTMYRKLFTLYRAWTAEARADAEANQLARTPSQWLERNTSSKLLDNVDDEQQSKLIVAPGNNGSSVHIAATQLLTALHELRVAGISLDDTIDKGTITIDSQAISETKVHGEDHSS